MNTRICWGACLAVAGVINAAQGGIFNGSFESANYVGWTLSSDVGTRASEPLTLSGGSARTSSSWGQAQGLSSPLEAWDGSRFLVVNTRANGSFLGNGNYDTYLSQTFRLNQGDRVSGWSYFFNGDAEANDSAWVRVRDGEGNLLGAPWLEASGASMAAALSPATPWSQWQWAAPTSGFYTIQLGVSASGANNHASYGFFDGLMVQTTPVPEPASMTLALAGGLALIAFRNRMR